MTCSKENRYSYDTFHGTSVTLMTRFNEKRYSYDTFQVCFLLVETRESPWQTYEHLYIPYIKFFCILFVLNKNRLPR